MNEREPDFIPLPFELPEGFVESLRYGSNRRLIAAYWDPSGDEVTVRDDAHLWCGFADWYPWVRFFDRPEVLEWKWAHGVDLGSSEEPASHWLIVDRMTNQAFVAPVPEAYKRIQQQRMEDVE